MEDSNPKWLRRQFEKILDTLITLVRGVRGEYKINLAVDAFYIICFVIFAFFFITFTKSLEFKYRDPLIFLVLLVCFYEIVIKSIRGCRSFIRDKLNEAI
jgi:hypothetical protein